MTLAQLTLLADAATRANEPAGAPSAAPGPTPRAAPPAPTESWDLRELASWSTGGAPS